MRLLFAFLTCLLILPTSQARDDVYPVRAITLVSPYAPGSDTDIYGQMLSGHVQALLGGPPMIHASRPGASGALATAEVHQAVPDGYTLLLARTGSQVITPAMTSKPPYRWDDFTVLAILGTNPLICAVRAKSPYQSAHDLLAAIRTQPGKLRYSTVGIGSIQNLAAQYLLALAGLKPDAAQAVHFESAIPATEAVISGRADFVCNNANTLIPRIKSGTLRGLFTTTPTRMSALPDLPNAREAGLRDMMQIQGWTALIGPANLPEEAKQKWQSVLRTLAQDPDWLADNIKLGGQSALLTIKNPDRFVHEQYAFYEKLITRLGIRK